MATINNFEDLKIWQESRELSKLLNQLFKTIDFKSSDHLRIQMERASGSIMDNIAEGFERGGNKEFIQFLYIAKASCGEVRSQLYRCYDYQLISIEQLNNHIEHTKILGRRIFAFINYLKKSSFRGDKYNSAYGPYVIYDKEITNQEYMEMLFLANEKLINKPNN